MQTKIALFRGINVGGNNILPMAELKNGLESLGLNNVRTYIQSGNVVFEYKTGASSALTEQIAEHVQERHGFRPQILLLSPEKLIEANESNPFPEAVANPSTLHFSFLATTATNPDHAALASLKTASERYQLTESVFYLHAPDGIGRSKLAAKVEKLLGVATTARNYRTVAKLLAMVR